MVDNLSLENAVESCARRTDDGDGRCGCAGRINCARGYRGKEIAREWRYWLLRSMSLRSHFTVDDAGWDDAFRGRVDPVVVLNSASSIVAIRQAFQDRY